VRARQAILASPVLYNRISRAGLPRLQHQMHQHISMGFVIKVHAVYETPFWREQGLSGTAFSPYELSHEAYDNTNHGDERGTLVGFVSDLHADGVFELSAEERKERILESLSHYYGPEAKNPVVYYESDWGSEEWTRGAYAASFDLGGLSRYGTCASRRTDPLRLQRPRRRGLPARRRCDPHGAPRRLPDPRRGPCVSRHVVVGYTATKTGRDAVAFAARLARATGAVLDVSIVLPSADRSVITPPADGYSRVLHEQAQQWIAEAIDRIPDDVVAHAQIRAAESFAAGLVQIADELGAGASWSAPADGATRGRHRLGSTTTELLHSSDVPVASCRAGRKSRPRRASPG
jgi:nucleotide-binding universal stress UspA family protein